MHTVRPTPVWAIALACGGSFGLVAGLVGGCGDTTAPRPTAAEYRATMNGYCTATRDRVDALPEPPDGISVTDFANEVASAIEREADQARGIDVPSDLSVDHRALVRNADEQARAWRELAALAADPAAPASDLGALRTRIGELTLGRDDLAAAMDLAACRADG